MGVAKSKNCTAFEADRRIATGSLADVACKVKEVIDRQEEPESFLIFDDDTGETIEVDFRGTVKDVLQRLVQPAAAEHPLDEAEDLRVSRRPGRPKLGVVPREVTLLPRHWQWLNCQPGGASVALRKLVEQARHVNRDRDKIRHAQEVAYRFMSTMAGNLPGFEEATRALFAQKADRFNDLIDSWPVDVRDYTRKLAEDAFKRPA